MTLSTFWVFLPTFAFVSVTPGMCMMLSLSLGMTYGVRGALPMMAGELLGVGLVAALSVLGVAAILLAYPDGFFWFKLIGGAYLSWLGIQMWQSKGKLAVPEPGQAPLMSHWALASQGFITAVFNPKGWAFFMALLPPFIQPDRPLATQLAFLIALILLMEFASLLLYASGGRVMAQFLSRSGNVRLINRLAGTLMVGVGVWLWLG